MPSCPTCDRRLSPGERFCTGCGEPTSGLLGTGVARVPGVSRLTRCPQCDHANRPADPFCARCGMRLHAGAGGSVVTCPSCGTIPTDELARLCAGCGAHLQVQSADAGSGSTDPRGVPVLAGTPSLTLLDSVGEVSRVIPLQTARSTLSSDELGLQVRDGLIGGDGAALLIADDGMRLEPVGTPRALFIFLTEETRLADGDILLLGSQVIRYRAVIEDGATYFADHGNVQVGSAIPSRDVAVLEQLRADGRVRDTLHLWPKRSILIGREEGDWLFPYDRTMSGKHAVISCDADGAISVRDMASRNGVALAVREPRELAHGQRVSLSGQVMRVDLA
ncbi:MAG: double zinc ribbon domain-containing protein [Gemmatimonadaceae bacterium]